MIRELKEKAVEFFIVSGWVCVLTMFLCIMVAFKWGILE